MNTFWIAAAATICFVTVLVILLFTQQGPRAAMPEVRSVPKLLSKALPWLITIAIICGIIYILPSPPKVQGKVDVSWLNTIDLGIAFAVVITLGLFYLVLNGKGGLPAAIALCIIVASFFFFGDDVFKVLKTVQKETAGVVLGTTQNKSARIQQPAKVIVQLSPEWSNPVRVIEGRCVFFWQETLGNHTTQLQLPARSDWVSFEEFRQLGGKKAERVRWTGNGSLGYEIRPDGQC